MIRNYKNYLRTVGTSTGKISRLLWTILTFSLVNNLLSFSKVVSISLAADGIDIVYGIRISTRIIVKVARKIPLETEGWATPDNLAQTVSKFIDEQKITKADFIFIIPRQWVILKEARFPVTVKGHLSNVVLSELDRITPLNPDNAFYDYTVIEEDPHNLTLLIAAVKRELISGYLEAFGGKHIKIAQIGVSPLVIGSLINKRYKIPDYVFICADDHSFDCGMVRNNFVVRSLYGYVSLWDETQIDTVVSRIRAFNDLLIRKGCPPRIVILAKNALYDGFRAKLRDLPVVHADQDLKMMQTQNKETPSAGALGGFLSAMNDDHRDLNLLSPRTNRMTKKPYALTGILSALIVFICAFYIFAPVVIERQKVEEMERRTHALKPEMKKIEALRKEAAALSADINMINNFKKQSVMTLDILREMTAIVPARTWLTRIRITDAGADIEGYATKATEIIPALENSRFFQKAEFTSPTFRDPRINNERFAIKMDLKNANAPKSKENTGKKNETKK